MRQVKNIFTVWLSCFAFAALTATVIISKRSSPKVENVVLDKVAATSNLASGAPGKVHDGDTLSVTFGNSIPVSIRLWGVDAPELGQAFGYEAKAFLESLIANKNIALEFHGNDKYGRKLCVIYCDNENVDLALISNGFAWAYPGSGISYQSAQAEAQTRRKGLWALDHPVAPWDWRKSK